MSDPRVSLRSSIGYFEETRYPFSILRRHLCAMLIRGEAPEENRIELLECIEHLEHLERNVAEAQCEVRSVIDALDRGAR
jgi:hypothetical protein